MARSISRIVQDILGIILRFIWKKWRVDRVERICSKVEGVAKHSGWYGNFVVGVEIGLFLEEDFSISGIISR